MEAVCNEAYPLADAILRPDFCRRVWGEHVAGQDRSRVLGAIAAFRGFSKALEHARARKPAALTAPVEVTTASGAQPGPRSG